MYNNSCIVSCQAESQSLALEEIKVIMKSIDKDMKLVKWLDDGVMLIDTELEFNTFSENIINNKPVYVRHICKVDVVINNDEDSEKNILKAINELCAGIDKNTNVSVQSRSNSNNKLIDKYELTQNIKRQLEESGFNVDVKNPVNVVSLFVTNQNVYIGISDVYHNISKYNGGMVKYKYEDSQISRASFKLQEAIEVFGLDISGYKTAIDLGASPGGWTKILADYKMDVVAVDPAELDSELLKYKNVTHYKGLSEDFVKTNDKKFDIIVNDMRMDVVASCEIVNSMSDNLSDDGIVIMTFKLPKSKSKGKILDGVRVLKQKYEIVNMKQLFYNRSEITVVLRLA